MDLLRGKRLFLKVCGGVAIAVCLVESGLLYMNRRTVVSMELLEAEETLRRRARLLVADDGVDGVRLRLANFLKSEEGFAGEVWVGRGRVDLESGVVEAGVRIEESPLSHLRFAWRQEDPRAIHELRDDGSSGEERGGDFLLCASIPDREGGGKEGVLLLRQDVDPYLARCEAHFRRQFRLGLARWGIVSGLLTVFFYAVVIRPVKRIVRANETAARGDLRHAYIPRSDAPKDEIGEIILSHNRMLRQFQNSRFIIRENNKVIQSINEKKTETNRRLKDLDRLKSQFLANMSHELRTPLNAIIGYTDLTLRMAHERLADKERRNLGIVGRQANNLLQLINEILDLSKIESGKMQVFVEGFALEEVVKNCVAAMEPLAKEKSLRLETRFEVGLPDLETDRTKVRQVLLNLLSNAVKFTSEGFVRVEVSRAELDGPRAEVSANGHLLDIVVEDSGIGIGEEVRAAVFEEFRQVDSSSTKRYPGTGLGLSIAKKLALLLGGDLFVESELDQGSRFTFRIPAKFEGESASSEA